MNDTVYINFCHNIQKKQVDNLVNTCNFAIQAHKPTNLYILFATGGGHIGLAFSLISFLKALPTNIIMHAFANIDSCGVNIFLAGNQRYATYTASFMMHPSTTTFKNDVSLSISQLQLELSMLQRDQNLVINNIAQNTSLSNDEAKKYIESGASLSADNALKIGIINEIKDYKIEQGAPHYQL